MLTSDIFLLSHECRFGYDSEAAEEDGHALGPVLHAVLQSDRVDPRQEADVLQPRLPPESNRCEGAPPLRRTLLLFSLFPVGGDSVREPGSKCSDQCRNVVLKMYVESRPNLMLSA